MGYKINAQNDDDSEYVSNIYWVNKMMLARVRNPLWTKDFLFKIFCKDAKAYYQKIDMMQNYTKNIIQARIAEREKAKQSEEHENLVSSNDKKRVAFLDLLLDCYDQGQIDLEGIREEVDTFMFEGHDTTSAALNMAFYHIAKDAHVQKKLQDEVDEIFRGDAERDVTVDDLAKMTYVDAFIREVLRLYPSVPLHARILSQDLKVNEKYTIPKGTNVGIFTYFIHRDPKHWGEDAEVFNPDRFLDNSIKRHAYSWVAFAAGSRNCMVSWKFCGTVGFRGF